MGADSTGARFLRRIAAFAGLVAALAVIGVVLSAMSAASTAVALPAAATAGVSSIEVDAQTAASAATAQGYRSGIGVLDLATGQYTGAGDDTGSFASESIAKVLIAAELLLSGQMTGSVETMAYQMITQSDDDDADALYGLVGGDNVINLIAAHYNIASLGTPPSQPGWWGNTEINAKGLVYLYAAIAKDATVGPWLMNAMANASEYGADGTYQFFGIPSATTGAAIKQGWGDDGDDSPNAVFNSSGYVNQNEYAVAILTDGPSASYGSAISAVVTAEAKALMPGGDIDDPAAHNPTIAATTVTATGNTVRVTGTATDPDAPGAALSVTVSADGTSVGATSTAADGRFIVTFDADNGSHAYTVTADNVGEGTGNTSVATMPVTVDGDLSGAITAVPGDPDLAAGQAPTAAQRRTHLITSLIAPSAGGVAVLVLIGLGVFLVVRRRRSSPAA